LSTRGRSLLTIWIALLVLAGCQPKPRTDHARQAEIGVEQLARTPAAYEGRSLVLRGVVSSAAGEEHMFTVIDEAEYRSCRELGCAAFEVPIAFVGTMPETARTVRVVGRLEQPEPGRYVVRAERVDPVP